MRHCRILLAPFQQVARRSTFLKWPLDPHVSVVRSLREIEAHWDAEVGSADLSTREPGVKSKYVLAMFPYPSGNLHMGHLRVYCISDSIARYYALRGYRVIHPIGWDAFGLPAENAARERGVDPKTWTYDNIGTMREQLSRTGLKFDWDRELFTCKPDYYRWTQWIFLQLHRHGLVRRAFSEVYWDPIDQTTLAAEQVDAQGRSWRSGALAERRKLHQWAVETPKYAKRLLDGLEALKPRWRDVADIQANWIGKCDAYRFFLPVKSSSAHAHSEEMFDLRVLDPQKLIEAAFLIIRDGHSLSTSTSTSERVEMMGDAALLDQTAYNFITDRHMPIVLVRDPEGATGDWLLDARVADPTCNEFDAHLSRLFSLGKHASIKSSSMSRAEICAAASAKGYGGYLTSRSLQDWVVSRQRAWGTPIPMVLDEKRHHFEPIGEDNLPVLSEQRGQRVTSNGLPSGHGFVETDTLDTFFDSSWYYLRYLDPNNSQQLVDPQIANRDLPVSVYVGGIEHAAVHLFFARFINHFLYDLGASNVEEPFEELVTQGTVRGKTYLMAESKACVRSDEVSEREGRLVHLPTGKEVKTCYDKMSKSKFNGVDPLKVISESGKDFAKLRLLAAAGPREYLDWGEGDDSVVKGMRRWIDRLAYVVNVYVKKRQESQGSAESVADPEVEKTLRQQRNSYVRDATIALEILRLHNICLEKLQSLTNSLRRVDAEVVPQSAEFERCVHALVIMLQVFAPSIASELWAALSSVPKLHPQLWKGEEPVWNQRWPQIDADAEVEFIVELFGTTSRARVNRQEIEHLGDGEILSLAEDSHHSLLFSLLKENSIRAANATVKRRPGLHVTIGLEFAKEVSELTAYSILDAIGKEKRRGKRRLGIKC